jgi:hypothetical protein
LLTVILLSLLSVLYLLVTNSVILGTRARESLQASMRMFYIAEAGLSHAQAFCVASGERSSVLAGPVGNQEELSEPEDGGPFGNWFPFGDGEYRIQAYSLGEDPQPFVERDSGILFVATARLGGEGRKRICLLVEEPPSCNPLAWWEPD